MKISLKSVLLDLRGVPIMDEGQPAMLGLVCVKALTATIAGETLPGEKKFERWMIAKRIYDAAQADLDPVEFSVQEVALLKELTGKIYGTEVVGSIWALFESAKIGAQPGEA
jgi:hypothetical protein